MRSRLAMLALMLGCSSGDKTEPADRRAPAPPVETADPPAAKAVADKEVVIPRIETRVGDVITTRLTGETTSGVVAQRDKFPASMDARLSKTRALEVTAVENGVVTGAVVSYLEERMDFQSGGKSAAWQPLLRGHQYDASWRGGKLELQRVKEAPMGAEETKRLRRDLRALVGQRDHVMQVSTGRTIKSGEVLKLPAEIAATLGERAEVREATVRLLDVRGDVAVLEVHLVYRVEEDGLGMDVKSRSALEVSLATGRPARQTSTSSLSMSAKGKGVVAFAYNETAEYTYDTTPLPVPPKTAP